MPKPMSKVVFSYFRVKWNIKFFEIFFQMIIESLKAEWTAISIKKHVVILFKLWIICINTISNTSAIRRRISFHHISVYFLDIFNYLFIHIICYLNTPFCFFKFQIRILFLYSYMRKPFCKLVNSICHSIAKNQNWNQALFTFNLLNILKGKSKSLSRS